jgi:hypothetical protein
VRLDTNAGCDFIGFEPVSACQLGNGVRSSVHTLADYVGAPERWSVICLFRQPIIVTNAGPDRGARACSARLPIVIRVTKSRWNWNRGQSH